jgi:hypothetical protein
MSEMLWLVPPVEYCYSLNEEDYENGGGTREEALAEAIVAVADRTGTCEHSSFTPAEVTTVYTARCIKRPPSYYIRDYAERMVEHAQEAAYEAVGDHAESWLHGVTKEQQAALDVLLQEVFDTWCEQTGHEPSFYGVEDVQEHELLATPGDE